MDSCKVSARRARGFTMLEVVAAAAVTALALSAVVPLFARQVRLVADTRRERVAVEELANQAERLAALPASEIDRALATVAVSAAVRDVLPAARLEAIRDGVSPLGERIVLTLVWDAVGRREQPLTLVTWIPPDLAEEETP